MKKALIVASAVLALSACDKIRWPGQKAPDVHNGVEGIVDEPAVDVTAPPAIPFKVKLTLSPAAKAKLTALNENVLINAQFYAMPKEGVVIEPGDVGIALNERDVEVLPEDQSVEIDGAYDADQLAASGTGDPRVLVNVFSARKSGPDNLLSCGIFDGTMAEAAAVADGVAVSCALIEEPS